MNRREFCRAAPAVAVAVVAAPLAIGETRQRIHLSLDRESPYYCAHPRMVAKILLDGKEVPHCVEASETEGFIIQSVNHARKNLDILRIPGAVFIPATQARSARVKRFGDVRIVLKGEALP
jgi:hypothetical protein